MIAVAAAAATMPVIVVAFDVEEWRPVPVAFAGSTHRSFERSNEAAAVVGLVDGLAADGPCDGG